MSEPFRIDWPELRDRIIEAGEEPASFCLSCLPVGGIKLILASLERLRWESTYRVDDYDFADFDDLLNIIDDTERSLSMVCEDVLTQITNIVRTEVTVIQASQDACCYLDSGQPTVDPPATDLPPGGGGSPPSGDELCKSAQLAHDNGTAFLNEVMTFGAAGGAITAGYLSFALAAYALSIPLALIATMIIALVAVLLDILGDELKADWVAMKAAAVCAIYTASTAGEARAQVHDVIDNLGVSDTTKTIFKALYNQSQINRIWSNEVGDTTGYDASYCDSCSEEVPFWLTFTFDTDQQGFSLSQAAYNSTDDCINLSVHESGGNSSTSCGYTNIKNIVGFPANSQMTIKRIECDFIGHSNLEGVALAFISRSTGVPEVSQEYSMSAGLTIRATFTPAEVWSTGNPNLCSFLGVKNGSGDPSFIMVDNVMIHGKYIAP